MARSKPDKTFLVGPFIGELLWECLYFAPYIIHLKKFKSKNKIVVFTRPSRFDLYGQYADILVPLNIARDDSKYQVGYGHKKIESENYEKLIVKFSEKYEKRFDIIRHVYPEISYFYYKVKWQFPRRLMDYDFKPRKQNRIFVENYLDKNNIVFIDSDFSEKNNLSESLEKKGYFCIFMNLFTEDFLSLKEENISFLGSVIEIIKRCKLVVSNCSSFIFNLSLLLGIPVITTGQLPSFDSISLVNPKRTMIINCEDIIEGVDIYEKEMKKRREYENYI